MLKQVVLNSIKTHYLNGHYLLYIPEKFVINGDYTVKYERYAGGQVLEYNQTIELFNKDIPIKIHKPYGKTHRYEYEYYFNFGPHCDKYDNNKTVIQCLRNPILTNTELETVLDNISNEYTQEDISKLLLLLLLGGFVNSLDCIEEISSVLPEININRENLFEYLVENLTKK
jgi:hypothetical protein